MVCVLCMRDHHDTGEGVCVCVLCMRDHHDTGEGACSEWCTGSWVKLKGVIFQFLTMHCVTVFANVVGF